jgi:hypothetical protein
MPELPLESAGIDIDSIVIVENDMTFNRVHQMPAFLPSV